MLAADHRSQKQLTEALKLINRLQTQMAEFERQQGPAKGPAQLELSEEAGSSSKILLWLVVLYSLLSITGSIPAKMAPKRAMRSNIAPETTNTTSVTNAQLQAMIDQGVTAALAARDANRNTNGDDIHNSGTGVRRTERAARECTYTDFLKCQPLNFKGTEGLPVYLNVALTWWNTHVKSVGHDAAYEPTTTEQEAEHWPGLHCKDWSTVNANNANNQRGTGSGQRPTCFECGVQGHFKRECPKLKNNNNRGNQVGGGNAPAKVYAVGLAGTNPDSNVVMGTFLLNNRYASILFDTGADRSFVSTAFSS
ncbi:reverse transcriptase domain-containing protein [Tanacetum coccineum]|uniref:Reverse transcriptase domain-containing protein n=1 Tax=Tanacetum coccineum TaxID=301880 RepID=A0ABQ5BGL7_9ASTR